MKLPATVDPSGFIPTIRIDFKRKADLMDELVERWLDGIRCYRVASDTVALDLAVDFGPRILGCYLLPEEKNILAQLPEAKLVVDGQADYSLWGGHRLWAAPEIPHRTYAADDVPPEITQVSGELTIRQETDRAGLQKAWRIQLDPGQAKVVISHELINQGSQPIEIAPWAITMLPAGGEALLPLPTGWDDALGLWPNRQLVFWPYTDLASPHLKIYNQQILVRAALQSGALKVGAPNPAGWIAYALDGLLFLKVAQYQEGAHYPDRGASHQIYCGPGVIELETLGPLTSLVPGDGVVHEETWELYPEGSWPDEIAARYRDQAG
jgi:hypothetical protein